ncbi:hypothetical protein WMY93_004793 [Mugilogobius chulae]|uniref:receptor protein-tyrosine kinase n=1 Tax=Mugilogobius chulae TaxID=88201 RepID=A0AAW0PQP7_9GOBI
MINTQQSSAHVELLMPWPEWRTGHRKANNRSSFFRMLTGDCLLLLLALCTQLLNTHCRPASTDEVPIETQIEPYSLLLGDPLALSCSIKDTDPAVNWTKDNVAIVDGEHTHIRNGQLEIETVELTDSGLYTCTTFGNHSLFFNVTVDTMASSEDDDEDEESSSEEAKLLGSQKKMRNYASSMGSAWEMEKKLHAVPASKTVKFRCQASGNPTPTLKWYKNGKEFKRDHRIGGFKVRDQVGTIIMESVVPSDKGNYTCVVENQYGSINHTYQLDVVERSPHRPILQAGLPANRTVVVGSDVEFECKVFSDPQPHIQWLKHIEINGSRVGPNGLPYVRVLKHSGVNSSDAQVLTLYNVTEEEGGEYTCKVSNYIGEANQSAWLTVTRHEPSAMPSYPPANHTYLEVVIYCVGFLIIVIMITVTIIVKIRSSSKKSDFNSQLAVHKLAKSIPLRRQVSVESSNSIHSGVMLVRPSRLSSRAPPCYLECPNMSCPRPTLGTVPRQTCSRKALG